MAEFRYGSPLMAELSEFDAAIIRDLALAIVRAGKSEWIPIPWGEDSVVSVLISPGVPMYISSDINDTKGRLDELIRTYFPRDE
jgi:hypothetical protein